VEVNQIKEKINATFTIKTDDGTTEKNIWYYLTEVTLVEVSYQNMLQ